MTETTTEVHAGVKLCRAGSKTDSPCWRPATEADLGETEPQRCALHMQVHLRAEDMDDWMFALAGVRDFLKSEAVEQDPGSMLRTLALGWLDSVTEQAAEAAHKLRVAEFLAARGPDDPGPENSVMREYGAHLHVRSDAMSNVFSTLIDERELSETERLLTIAAIKDASKQVNEEYDKFRRDQGLRD